MDQQGVGGGRRFFGAPSLLLWFCGLQIHVNQAIEGMNGQDLDGRNITVNEAQSRGSGGFRSGNDGGGRREGGGGGYNRGYGCGGDGYGGDGGYGGGAGGYGDDQPSYTSFDQADKPILC
ncbi:hypothetical protein Dimus_007238 [Dionaea muscipula]